VDGQVRQQRSCCCSNKHSVLICLSHSYKFKQIRNVYKILVISSEENRLNGKPWNTQENNIKMDNRKIGHGLHSSGLGGVGEDGNKPLSSILFTLNLKINGSCSSEMLVSTYSITMLQPQGHSLYALFKNFCCFSDILLFIALYIDLYWQSISVL
jgi:hypothetical protein